MNTTNKNMDAYFATARKSKVSLTTERVATALTTGVAVSAASAASAGFLGISKSTLMIGTILTTAATATLVGVNLSDDTQSETSAQPGTNTEQMIADISSESELAKAFEVVQQTLSDIPIVSNPAIESSYVDSEIQLANGQTLHFEQSTSILPELNDTTNSALSVVMRWDDSEEDFRSKVDFLRSQGLRVLANRFNFKDRYHIKLNIVDTSGRGSDLISINLSGQYEVELGWQTTDEEKREFYYKTASKGSISTVKNSIVDDSGSESSGVLMNSVSTSSDGTTSTRTVTAGSSAITTTTVTVDSDGNKVKDKTKEISRERETKEK